MLDLRWWSVSSVAWLLALYGIERVETLGASPLLYPTAAVLLVLLVLIPWLHERWRECVVGAAVLFLGAKHALGYGTLGTESGGTLFELLAVGLTVWLGSEFGNRVAEFRNASTNVMIQHLRDSSTPFEVGQSQIYREIRRARRHERPAALLTISLDPAEVEAKAEPLMLEVQRDNIARYATARLAEILDQQTQGYGIITQRDDHFVALLPETDAEQAAELSRRLSKVAGNELGLKLRMGFSTFPDEELTLASLIERAEREMKHQQSGGSDSDGEQTDWVISVPQPAQSREGVE